LGFSCKLQTSRLNQISEHASGSCGAVGFDRLEPRRRAHCGNHGLGNHIGRRCREPHALAGTAAVEPVGDVEVLFEVVVKREVKERSSGRREPEESASKRLL
jgi:hypothetical protein